MGIETNHKVYFCHETNLLHLFDMFYMCVNYILDTFVLYNGPNL